MDQKKYLKNNEYYARVPGTSANLGPGFDILGLALQIYNEFYFKFGEEFCFEMSLLDERPIPFPVQDNLLFLAYKKYFETFLSSKSVFPYKVRMDLGLPLKGGLGSSASAIVAGFSAGFYIHKKMYPEIFLPSESEILFHLAEMEGHPDNTTPAYLGGFIFSYFKDSKLIYYKKYLPETMGLFLFIPDLETETNDSRKKLPEKYCTDDIVFNMARLGTWMQFLQSGNFEDLKLATEDKVHTPYRINQLPFLEKVGQIIEKMGCCFTLSGSGPTLLIYCPENRKNNFIKDFKILLGKEIRNPIHYRILETSTCLQGLITKEISTGQN